MFREDIGPVVEQAVAQGLRVKLQPQGVTGLNFAELNYVSNPAQFPPLKIWWTPKHFLHSLRARNAEEHGRFDQPHHGHLGLA